MKKVVGLGDFLVSLNPKGYLRFIQATEFEISYTGAEANVLVSLSCMGVPTEFVTRIPNNEIAQSGIAHLKKFGVGTNQIVFGGERIGTLYMEKGAAQRSSKVIYDRKFSGICEAQPEHFHWEAIFKDASWFHLTGITPALSESTARVALVACQEAKKRGVPICCDLNYRQTLWTLEEAKKTMEQIVPLLDILIVNEEHAKLVLGIKSEKDSKASIYADIAKQIAAKYGVPAVALTIRQGVDASENDWAAMLYQNGEAYFSRNYRIHIVNRIGGGDAFAAGLIYARLHDFDPQKTIEYATAASCLKHSIEFDFNLSTVSEIMNLVEGGGCGRVQR